MVLSYGSTSPPWTYAVIGSGRQRRFVLPWASAVNLTTIRGNLGRIFSTLAEKSWCALLCHHATLIVAPTVQYVGTVISSITDTYGLGGAGAEAYLDALPSISPASPNRARLRHSRPDCVVVVDVGGGFGGGWGGGGFFWTGGV